MTACSRNVSSNASRARSWMLPVFGAGEQVPNPSPLVGEGREGGKRFARSAREAILICNGEGGPLPPSPALPHKGGEGRVALVERGAR